MEAIKMLKRQHRTVEGLFRQIEKSDDPGECRDLLQQVEENLRLHMELEEEIFYPAVREVQSKKAEEMVNEAYEEHGVVKLVLAQLPEVNPGDERFHAKMTVLSELIEHHVEEEEKEMFKLAEKLGDEELERIGEQMQARAGEEAGEASKRQPAGARRGGMRKAS
jgi:hemerythrin-like domain-containing protein